MKKFIVIIGTLFFILSSAVVENQAATFTVDNTNNMGAGSLRQAVLDANASSNANDTIEFTSNARGKIVLTGFEIEINKPIGTNLTINGPGANLLSIETNFAFRVFRVQLGNIKISGLRISRGFAPDGFVNRGGGIWVVQDANLTLENCRITENQRGGIYTQSGSTLTVNNSLIAGNDGGGIISEGILTMTNSTVADNTGDDGAGISESGGSMSLTNVTVSGNRGFQVGGISVNGGFTTILNSTISNNGNVSPSGNVGGLKSAVGATVNLKNTIIARNLSSTIAEDVSGTIFSQGTNLIGDTTGSMGFTAADLQNVNPQLGGFANNGGATYTYSLRSTSPAINAGNNAGAPATDQRGVARPQGAAVDIGSFETGVLPVAYGKIVFVSDRNGNREIYSMNSDATGQTRLTTNSATDEFPDWSPDGKQIAFSTNRDGNFEIYTLDANTLVLSRLTTNSVPDSEPAWSPDGYKIAFVRNGAGIWTMDATGGMQTAVPNTTDGASPSWSPDGTQIVFTCSNMGSAICKINADGTNRTPFVFTDAIHTSPAWSPDGNSIAFSLDLNVSPFLYFYSPYNPNVLRPMLAPNEIVAFDPAFSPDGAKLAYTNGDLYLRDADGGNPVLLINRLVNGNSYHPDWFGQNTPTGANVTAVSGTVSITFSSVGTSGGTTTVVPIDPTTAGSVPSGYSLGAGFPAYEITTTANYTAPIIVCLQVPSTTSLATFNALRILHFVNGTPTDATILAPNTPAPNFASKTICANVNSLSPFVVAKNLAPTAANVIVGGRVLTSNGYGVSKARVSITNQNGETRSAITNSFGYYRLDEIPAGATYVISVRHKVYQFNSQVVTVSEDIQNADFTAEPELLNFFREKL